MDDHPMYIADNADNRSVLDTWYCIERNIKLNARSLYLDGYYNTLCLSFSLYILMGTPSKGFTMKVLDTESSKDGHKTSFDSGTLYLNFKDATSIMA